MKQFRIILLWIGAGLWVGCSSKPKPTDWTQIQQRLDSLYPRKTPPMPGDWLTDHPETYQSFEHYQQKNTTRHR